MYAGQHVATIRQEHVRKGFFRVHKNFWLTGFGLVQQQDVGKQVLLHKGVITLESNEQRDKRVG